MNRIITYLFLFVCVSSLFAQKKLTRFQHTFNAAGMNGGLYVESTPDSGFVVTGQHESSGAGSCDIYLYKRNKCGQIIFYKTYGGTGAEGGTSVKPTPDGGLMVAAFSSSYPAIGTCGAAYNAQLLKLNAMGNVQWHKVYCNAEDDRFYGLDVCTDAGYIAAGTTLASTWAAYVVRTDVNGVRQWGNKYLPTGGGWDVFRAKYVEQTADGGFMVIGKVSLSPSQYNYMLCLMKLDAAGNVQWCRRYNQVGGSIGPGENEEDDYSVSGQETPDGGFIATVAINGAGGMADQDIMVTKLDVAGNVQWARAYGGPGKDQPRNIRMTSDGGYAVSGYTMSFGGGEQDAYLLKLDVNGTLEWSRAYGGPLREKAEGVREFYDGGFVLDGHTASFGANVFDVYSLKTDSLGHTGCNEVDPPTQSYNVALSFTNTPITVTPSGGESVEPIQEADFTPAPVVLCEEDLTLHPDFTLNDACLNTPIQFSDNSTSSNGVLNYWRWDFGDGTLDSLNQDPIHTYATADTFIVELKVNSTEACFPSTMIDTLVIYPYPDPGFTATPVCVNNPTLFTDTSSTPLGNIIDWSWNFGDATVTTDTSSQQHPTYTYPVPGTYNISLAVTSMGGCKDSVVFPVLIDPLPVPDYATGPVCLGDSVSFIDGSTSPNGTSVSAWNWTFGETGSPTNTSTQTSPSHLYNTAGTYSITLVTTNNKGCIDSVQKTVVVAPLPLAAFTPQNVCVNVPLPLSDASNGNGGAINDWHWDFGDTPTNDTAGTQNTSYTYTTAGNYSVTLQISTSAGCKDTVIMPLTVYPSPVANYSGIDVCLYNTTTFSDSSNTSVGNISSYHWDFGVSTLTNDTSNISSPTYNYITPGIYTVSLSVVANGCPNSVNKIVEVYPLPVASFSGNEVCLNATSTFTNISSVPGGTISFYHWDFGDIPTNDTSNLVSPTWIYTAPGIYTVSLAVLSNHGCPDTAISPVNVNPLPFANFGPGDDGCMPVCVTMADLSTVASPSNVTTWIWDLGDGTFDFSQTPKHCYNNPGVYDMSLIIATDKNCKDTIARDSVVMVYPFPDADFSVSPDKTSILDPHFSFTDLSTGAPVSWTWDFGDESGISTIQHNEYTYPEVAATYTITLDIVNEYGCPSAIEKVVEVTPEWTFYVPNTFTPNGDGVDDVFFGTGIGHVEKEMWIYDRWGNEIYHIEGLSGTWDGKVQGGSSGEISQIDTYVWLIRIKEIFGGTHNYIGHVNLIK